MDLTTAITNFEKELQSIGFNDTDALLIQINIGGENYIRCSGNLNNLVGSQIPIREKHDSLVEFMSKEIAIATVRESTRCLHRDTLSLLADFSPCWNQSISSNCKDISSIDVPILPQYKYKVVRSIITNGMARAYAVNITQKLVISKNTKSDKILQYHMALIPDNSYYKKNKGDIGTHFISHGDKNEYSGLVIYSLPRIKMPVKIERYVSGEKIFSMLIPSKTSEETRLKKRIFKNLVKDMKFAVSRTTQTRFGEYDDGDWEEGDDDNWWEEEGFYRELVRKNSLTAPNCFELPYGGIDRTGGQRGKLSTRCKFPQCSPDLKVRWCSSYLKIDVCSSAIINQ